VVVVPLTTTVRGLSNEVELDVTDGLPRACVTSFDNRALNATVACPGG
jgi:mRNA-degrading endonuclease toxin of MazEF toxin-antitoxin module